VEGGFVSHCSLASACFSTPRDEFRFFFAGEQFSRSPCVPNPRNDLIEQSYSQNGVDLSVFSSNFDFTIHDNPAAVKLFKLHGTIEKDVSDGHVSRIIITDTDYDQTEDYRQSLFDRLRSDLAGAHLLIIGYSLADPEIKEIITRAASINKQTMGSGRISLLLYSKDQNLALLYENRGIEVCFAGIDEFFAELARKQPPSAVKDLDSGRPLSKVPALLPITVDIKDVLECSESNVSAMFNGYPADYADIAAGLTFRWRSRSGWNLKVA
jgi:SIR2-like domain